MREFNRLPEGSKLGGVKLGFHGGGKGASKNVP